MRNSKATRNVTPISYSQKSWTEGSFQPLGQTRTEDSYWSTPGWKGVYISEWNQLDFRGWLFVHFSNWSSTHNRLFYFNVGQYIMKHFPGWSLFQSSKNKHSDACNYLTPFKLDVLKIVEYRFSCEMEAHVEVTISKRNFNICVPMSIIFLGVKNFVEITLSHSIFEINMFFAFYAEILNGHQTTFGKSRQ